LIIATTSRRRILKQMDMIDAFASEIKVPAITSLSEIDIVLKVMNKMCSLYERPLNAPYFFYALTIGNGALQ
jgi:vesicle-fusing ATPase